MVFSVRQCAAGGNLHEPRILFVGAGAVGSYLASFFARAGHDVTVIDSWPEQVETIRQRGVSVTGPHEPFTARFKTLHVHEAQQLGADFDIGVVAMKSYDTAWAAHLLAPHVKPSGIVICAQNCWNDPLVASIAGPERTVGLIMSGISVAMWKPGEVERGAERGAGHVVFRAGSPDGQSTPHLQAVADLLSVVDAAQTTDNLWGERWGKLCINAMGNPVQSMTGLGGRDIASEPRGREITIRLGSESARVGLALGHRVVKFGAAPAEQWAEAGTNRRHVPGDRRRHRPQGRLHPKLAFVHGPGRDQGPPHGDRVHERLRGGEGQARRGKDAGVRGGGRDRARDRRQAPEAIARSHRGRAEEGRALT